MPAYRLYVLPATWKTMKELPGNIRQRVKRAVEDLAEEPRPSSSKRLDFPIQDYELRRQRIENWRIVYAISEDDETLDVLAVKKRPPYNYDNLADLIAEIL